MVIHGDKDKICNLQDSKYFIDNIKHKYKELCVMKDGYHEMYIDFEKEEFSNKVFTWITKAKGWGKTDKRKLFKLFF